MCLSDLAVHTLHCRSKSEDQFQTPITLSPFDQLAGTPVPIAVLFIYRHGLDANLLQTSLEHLLDYYPILTGRFQISTSDGSYQISKINTGAQLHLTHYNQPLKSFSTSDDVADRFTVTDLP
ncbi:hypothetical protein GEMRC1_004176 [Eukaryota sp. GEM-RC1]